MNFEYNLVWNGEVIDTAPTKKEALTLKLEYELAFNSSNVMIKRVEEKTLNEKNKIIRAKMSLGD